jgi:hypothetical protein
MRHCLHCSGPLVPVKLSCPDCGMIYAGKMRAPRLARLSRESLDLAERLILAGGNLKDVAGDLGISYPTLRRRVDTLIEELEMLKQADQKAVESILSEIESGALRPEEGARLIKEVNGSL